MSDFYKVTDILAGLHRANNKILICGNGGLAAEAEHFAAECVGKFAFNNYLPCIALTANSSLVTAISNDMGFENVFAHQVKVFGVKGDVLIAMTTSQSKNILKALWEAKQMGLTTIAICAEKSVDVFADHIFRTYGEDVSIRQNQVIQLLHKLAYAVKEKINARLLIAKPE